MVQEATHSTGTPVTGPNLDHIANLDDSSFYGTDIEGIPFDTDLLESIGAIDASDTLEGLGDINITQTEEEVGGTIDNIDTGTPTLNS